MPGKDKNWSVVLEWILKGVYNIFSELGLNQIYLNIQWAGKKDSHFDMTIWKTIISRTLYTSIKTKKQLFTNEFAPM